MVGSEGKDITMAVIKNKCLVLGCENPPVDVFGFFMCQEHLACGDNPDRHLFSIDIQREWVCKETFNHRVDGWRVKFGPLDVWTPNRHLLHLAFRKSQEWGTYNPFYTMERRRAMHITDERIFSDDPFTEFS